LRNKEEISKMRSPQAPTIPAQITEGKIATTVFRWLGKTTNPDIVGGKPLFCHFEPERFSVQAWQSRILSLCTIEKDALF
jgi:hypothetical protein